MTAPRYTFTCALVAIAVASTAPHSASPRAAAPQSATIEIDATTIEGRISPMLYGQFIEYMFEGIKGGLHAELLRNRGFEAPPSPIGLSQHWERYPDDRNDDYGLSFAWDAAQAYPAASRDGRPRARALRIDLKPAVVARHGVYQPRIPVRGDVEYRVSFWLRSGGFSGRVGVALEADATGGRVYDERTADIAGPASGWQRCQFTLSPRVTDPLARFAILVDGAGTVWIDHASLMPADAVDGVRADVFQKVRDLAPAFIRWPGGNVAQDYHWRWGIGPRDERPTWVNLSWKHESEPSDFGTGEFIRFARNVGAEPSITVNVEGRGATVEEAAAWVEYSNGPPESAEGRVRAEHGHRDPYRVKYWEIGNEIWGDWVRGHSDAAAYARNVDRYVAAMRAVDPSIQVIAVGDNDMAWNRTVLGMTSQRLDYLAIHHYYGRREMEGDVGNLLARPLHYERFYGEIERAFENLPANRRPKLAVNEWGLDLPESQEYSMLAALYGARLMNVFERQDGLIAMSAVSDLVNGWPGGIIQASRHGVFVTPIYLVNRLYATRLGAERLSSRVEGPTFSTSKEGIGVPVLDVTASRSADGREIFITAVNTDLARPLRARVTLRGAAISARARVERVVGNSLTATNGFTTPDAVRITHAAIPAARTFRLDLPEHSVSVVTLTVQR
jgi:alpha-N-arabinofuranosidase